MASSNIGHGSAAISSYTLKSRNVAGTITITMHLHMRQRVKDMGRLHFIDYSSPLLGTKNYIIIQLTRGLPIQPSIRQSNPGSSICSLRLAPFVPLSCSRSSFVIPCRTPYADSFGQKEARFSYSHHILPMPWPGRLASRREPGTHSIKEKGMNHSQHKHLFLPVCTMHLYTFP
jgi:hypothetical protein